MEAHWLWWMFAVILVVSEMLTGTLYLLAVAFGLAVAGLAAFLGASWAVQVVLAALLCSVSVAWTHRWKKQHAQPEERSNLANDIGQEVRVVSWKDDRNARVSYRGAEWDARLADDAVADRSRQTWRTKDMVGSMLIIQ
ncbi:MAG: NfeD family protein [Sideroxydans sp.]|nr:NfeD family protein [Sideroxydans sp.]